MGYLQAFRPSRRSFITSAAVIAVTLLFASECAAQAAPAAKQPDDAFSQELSKHPGLPAEFSRLLDRLQKNLHYPPARAESRLLPLLPESTVAYLAYPNYGDLLHQALMIFRQEREESPVLREWWQQSEMAAAGPQVENAIERLYQLSQYLGDELVVSGDLEGRAPKLLIVAEVRKQGLKMALEQVVSDFAGKSPPGVIVFDEEELEIAKDRNPGQEPVVLVRPDFLVAALDVATLRSFNTRLDQAKRGFLSAPFSQRIQQAYQGGVTIVGAADLQSLLSLIPINTEQERATFRRSGFADMKYLVWEHTTLAGQDVSEAELSFLGPRHGVASWLAAPARLGSLDFVSPKSLVAATVLLKSPPQILEDVQELARASHSDPFVSLAQMEQATHLSFKEDVLRPLGGEITFELDTFSPPEPVWKAIFQVNDGGHLQQTFSTLLATLPFATKQSDESGVTYHTVAIPNGEKVMEIGYAFADGYLVVASSREAAVEAVRLHSAGESLGKSKKLLAALPPGHPGGASAMFYQDSAAMAAAQFAKSAPGLAESLAKFGGEGSPSVLCAYGEETAIREAGASVVFDAGLILVAAAIAIPNLLRSRMAANEASAVGMVRTVNTAQVTYASTYDKRGFAPDLASLGPDPRGGELASAEHADLIDSVIGNASCTAGAWCTKSGYRFSLKTTCIEQLCTEYVLTATPVSDDTGTRNFCSTTDGIVRSQTGPPLSAPLKASECRAWEPLHQ